MDEAHNALETLLGKGSYTLETASFENASTFETGSNRFHPTRTALLSVNGTAVGVAGELDHTFSQALNLPGRVGAFEIDLDALNKFISPTPFKAAVVSTAPIAREDYAFVVSDQTSASALQSVILKAIAEVQKGAAEEVSLFDIFEGGNVPDGKKSLSFAVTLRAEHTLSHEQINAVRQNIIKRVEEFGGALRA